MEEAYLTLLKLNGIKFVASFLLSLNDQHRATSGMKLHELVQTESAPQRQ